MVTGQAETIQSFNPANGELLGEVPCFSASQVTAVVNRAWTAFESWSLTDYRHRASKIMSLHRLLVDGRDEIARLITSEVGKPLAESYLAELTGPLDACLWFARNSEKMLKDEMIKLSNPLLITKESIVTFDPVGVVGIIAPWNYPFAIPVMTMIMALMAGNTVVLKPSEKASLTGLKILQLFEESGFPQATVSVVTGGPDTGKALSGCRLGRLYFTGSVAGGQAVTAQAASTVVPVSLELGGKDAAIVLPDAPIEWTARGLVWGAFTNSGQACASVERVYLVKGEHAGRLIEQVVAQTRALKMGSGQDPEVDVGPLIDEEQLSKVESQVNQARSMGAKVLCGGSRRTSLGGHFYEPTVLSNVNHSMSIMVEETFGPVLPIMLVDSEDQAVEMANESQFGLSASVWSSNLGVAENVARDLEVGTVFINDGLFSFACPEAPWGGIKKSGNGRSHGYFGMVDMVNIKHIAIDSAGGWHRMWWYPYGQGKVKLASGGLQLLHGSLKQKLSGLAMILGAFRKSPRSSSSG